jgi:hypothetical protein
MILKIMKTTVLLKMVDYWDKEKENNFLEENLK